MTNASQFDQGQIASNAIKRQLNMILDVGIDGYDDIATLRKVNRSGHAGLDTHKFMSHKEQFLHAASPSDNQSGIS